MFYSRGHVSTSTLNTQFMKNQFATASLETVLKSPRTHIVDDREYRDDALEAILKESSNSEAKH